MAGPLVACVGGFLGAGKTTALAAAARVLAARGMRVGIVTNDQGSRLVDTELLRAAGLAAEEVTGGCFCCRFDELVERAERILERERPDIIFAEAVGSCTDLAATVLRPLARFYADRFELAPLTVFVDPLRLSAERRGFVGFPGSVAYLFDRQLAEADVVVLNKIDLLVEHERRDTVALLERRLDGVSVRAVSAASGEGIAEWVDGLVAGGRVGNRELDLDYDTYTQAEAPLGWLNARVDLTAEHGLVPRDVGQGFVEGIRRRTSAAGGAVAHVKVLVATEEGSGRVGVTDAILPPRWTGSAELAPARELSVIVNARVRASPDELERCVRETIANIAEIAGATASVLHLECFSPEAPRPSHRFPASSEDHGA